MCQKVHSVGNLHKIRVYKSAKPSVLENNRAFGANIRQNLRIEALV